MTNSAMKISGYIRYALMIIVLVNIVHSAVPQDRINSQILDPYVMDVRAKKPFCNAFTGCGRKRSSPSGVVQNSNPLNDEGMKVVRIPLPLYRALLRAAASQEMNNQIEHQDQSVSDYNRQQEYPLQEFTLPSQKNQQRDQYES